MESMVIAKTRQLPDIISLAVKMFVMVLFIMKMLGKSPKEIFLMHTSALY